MTYRIASADDVDAATATIALAFRDDPVWGPALARADGDASHLEPYWRLYVEGALAHSTVFLIDDAAAVAVWVPPGAAEMSPAQQDALELVVSSTLDAEARLAMHELWSRFDAARPTDEPHAYLSLLATHPEHRGRGIGQGLLAHTIAHFAAIELPAYLESTNPANDHRYARAGFTPISTFHAVLDDAPITRMWRPAHPQALPSRGPAA